MKVETAKCYFLVCIIVEREKLKDYLPVLRIIPAFQFALDLAQWDVELNIGRNTTGRPLHLYICSANTKKSSFFQSRKMCYSTFDSRSGLGGKSSRYSFEFFTRKLFFIFVVTT